MPGLVPGIHVFKFFANKDVKAGTSPAMTERVTIGRVSRRLFYPHATTRSSRWMIAVRPWLPRIFGMSAEEWPRRRSASAAS